MSKSIDARIETNRRVQRKQSIPGSNGFNSGEFKAHGFLGDIEMEMGCNEFHLASVGGSCMLIFMREDDMKENRSFSRGCVAGMLILFLAFGLMFSTMNSLRHNDNDTFSCFGGLGAGFPVSFLCDYSGGGSPISSAGKIDSADFPYFSPVGTLVDMLFCSIQLGMVWLILNSISRKSPDGRPASFITTNKTGTKNYPTSSINS